jgi:hypothetical protein
VPHGCANVLAASARRPAACTSSSPEGSIEAFPRRLTEAVVRLENLFKPRPLAEAVGASEFVKAPAPRAWSVDAMRSKSSAPSGPWQRRGSPPVPFSPKA